MPGFPLPYSKDAKRPSKKPAISCLRRKRSDILAVGVKYWNEQGGKCLCEEQDKEQLFSFLGILGSG